MHKYIKIIITSTTLFCSCAAVHADSLIGDEGTKFYFTVGGGIYKQQKLANDSIADRTFNGLTVPGAEFKYKKQQMNALSVGVGYYVLDKLRIEAAFIKPFIKGLEVRSDTKTVNRPAPFTPVDFNYVVNQKADINAVQLRAYFDALDLKEFGSLYVGAGVGISQIRYTVEGKVEPNRLRRLAGYGPVKKAKTSNAVNWSIGAGVNLNIAQGIKLGLGYEFFDFGKTKTFVINQNTNQKVSGKSFRGHGAVLKLIYNI
jgi:opacity protein-like surface antigen